MPALDCQVTVCPGLAAPLVSARACEVQLTVTPAATDSMDVRAERVGATPPLKWACRLAPLVREAVTIEAAAEGAVMFIVATPSPVAAMEQDAAPQERVAFPLTPVKVTVTPPAGTRSGERAVTVKGMGTPIGMVLDGA